MFSSSNFKLVLPIKSTLFFNYCQRTITRRVCRWGTYDVYDNRKKQLSQLLTLVFSVTWSRRWVYHIKYIPALEAHTLISTYRLIQQTEKTKRGRVVKPVKNAWRKHPWETTDNALFTILRIHWIYVSLTRSTSSALFSPLILPVLPSLSPLHTHTNTHFSRPLVE